jgi:hypothetical protein
MGEQELLTLKEEAARLRVPLSWMYSRTRIKGSDFPCIRVGKYIRVNHEDVMAWIGKQNRAQVGA